MSARATHAREAVTRITRAHHLPGVTLCQVAIHTGRTHQIRVHLSAIGHPIVGDSLYGGRAPPRRRAISARCSGSSARSCTRRGSLHASARRTAHGVHQPAAGRTCSGARRAARDAERSE